MSCAGANVPHPVNEKDLPNSGEVCKTVCIKEETDVSLRALSRLTDRTISRLQIERGMSHSRAMSRMRSSPLLTAGKLMIIRVITASASRKPKL